MRYTIKPGDTLSELAKKHGTTVPVLATANLIANPDKIYAGREIWLPDPKGSAVEEVLRFDVWAAIKRFFGL